MIRNTAVNDISVKIGEELKLDVLLPNARQVMHQNISSTEWKKVWKKDSKSRVNRVNDRLNDSNGTLSIKEFTADDAGTYRVLGFEGEILITVTVTDEKSISSTESRGNLTCRILRSHSRQSLLILKVLLIRFVHT
uniref:Uncharacterized protein n=1 Tax=Cyprinus carpio TaxID=7962 RepID=A0A8C2FN15_CYPCA